MQPQTANEKFRLQGRTITRIAIAASILFHVGLLLFGPSFSVDLSKADAAGPRFVLSVGDWQAPTCADRCGNDLVAFDTTWVAPELTNRAALEMEIPGRYPPLLWRHREPSQGIVEIAISRSGRVRSVVLLESSENGGEETLAHLAGKMRFDPVYADGSRVAVVATVGLRIRARGQNSW